MDDVNILHVFWRRKWLFLLVFISVLCVGGAYMFYKSSVQNAPLSEQYIASMQIKNISRDITIPSKVIAQILAKIRQNPDATDSRRSMLANTTFSEPTTYDNDVVWILYQARDAREADKYYKYLQESIDSSEEFMIFKDRYSAILQEWQGVEEPNHEIVRLKDALQNGIALWVPPQRIENALLTQTSIRNNSIQANSSNRSKAVLLMTSAFVLAALVVFLAEFFRLYCARIISRHV